MPDYELRHLSIVYDDNSKRVLSVCILGDLYVNYNEDKLDSFPGYFLSKLDHAVIYGGSFSSLFDNLPLSFFRQDVLTLVNHALEMF